MKVGINLSNIETVLEYITEVINHANDEVPTKSLNQRYRKISI